METSGNYLRSLKGTGRIPVGQLRNLANTLPAQRCIRRIANTIISMPWSISPPEEDAKKDSAIKLAREIKRALKRPNREIVHNTYGKMVKAIVGDIATLSFSAIERQKGSPKSQPFWVWVADGASIHLNPDWNPSIENAVPKFFDYATGIPKPINSENLFLIQDFANSYELTPISVLEFAYNMIEGWLGISRFQFTTTTNAIREYMLILEEVETQEELETFREYWRTEVEGEGHIPILNGKVNVIKLGARNDEELYLKYNEYLLRMIALAFGMSARDMNITEHDNRATAGVAADSSFQDAALPMAHCLAEHINNELVDYYHEGFIFEFSDTEPRSQKDEADTAKTLYDSKIISRNEARLRIGEEALEVGGDVFSDGSKVGEEPEEQPAPDPNQPPPGQPPVPGQPPGTPPPPPGDKKKEVPDEQEPPDNKKAAEKDKKKEIASSASAANDFLQLSLFKV
jgi:hypothetical protein